MKNCVVTGGNQGIGLEIVRQLAQRAGTRTVLAARSEERGRAALAPLHSELAAAGVADAAQRLEFQQLDLTDQQSVSRFAGWAQQELKHVDVLVNNAGFAYKGDTWGADEAAVTIGTNYHGTKHVTEALLGLVPDGGRIVNVCSSAGHLSILKSPELRAKFEHAASTEDLDALTAQFVEAIRQGTHAKEGWPNSMYGVSKLAEISYTKLLAKQLAPRRIAVTAVCPGWCSTSMSSFRGPRSPAEGADTPVWLAMLPEAEALQNSGKFFRDRSELVW